MPTFAVTPQPRERAHLPAWQRRKLRILRDGRTIAACLEHEVRTYVHPFCTPRGFPVTAHNQTDFPHQGGVWLAHGKLNGNELWIEERTLAIERRPRLSQTGDRAQYRLGRVTVADTELLEQGERAVIEQRNQWLDADGQPLLEERRRLAFVGDSVANVLDITSAFQPLVDAVEFGATNHGFFAVRVEDLIDVEDAGQVANAEGRVGVDETNGRVSRWVDCTGRLGGERVGIAAYVPDDGRTYYWHITAYGLMIANPFRHEPATLRAGETWLFRFRAIAHDGWLSATDLAGYALE
ncbi:MAG: PmoA family protein [Chloroflexi bacterium]|nr:PmoA family protein [Chloroflexota bacterium]